MHFIPDIGKIHYENAKFVNATHTKRFQYSYVIQKVFHRLDLPPTDSKVRYGIKIGF